MSFAVHVGPKALDDLQDIFDWIADRAGIDVADEYLERIGRALRGLSEMPHRGTLRDDLASGLRTIPFERRATIAYLVVGEVVTVQRVLHAGRDLQNEFDV